MMLSISLNKAELFHYKNLAWKHPLKEHTGSAWSSPERDVNKYILIY